MLCSSLKCRAEVSFLHSFSLSTNIMAFGPALKVWKLELVTQTGMGCIIASATAASINDLLNMAVKIRKQKQRKQDTRKDGGLFMAVKKKHLVPKSVAPQRQIVKLVSIFHQRNICRQTVFLQTDVVANWNNGRGCWANPPLMWLHWIINPRRPLLQ